MSRRYVLLGLAAIATLAVASPVFGIGGSLKKAIRKEVSKQIDKATGPAGAPGAAGTARAFALVDEDSCGSPTGPCTDISPSKGVTSVSRVATGTFCVVAPGLSPTNTAPVASYDYSGSGADGDAILSSDNDDGGCAQPGFEIRTTGTTTNTPINNVSFSVVIP
jgi:hypothetical protein